MKIGIFAEKLGMSRIFDSNGSHIPVTLLKSKVAKIVGIKSIKSDGYDSVMLGFEEVTKEKKINKPQLAFLLKNKLPLYRFIKEFRANINDSKVELGQTVDGSLFKEVNYVDVRSKSKGKGFAGVMKRHNFSGLRASHGVSISHRSHGSTGNSRTEGKVYKGKKMAGHLGHEMVTLQNLKLVLVDIDKGILAIKGGIPGAKGQIVEVRVAKKKK